MAKTKIKTKDLQFISILIGFAATLAILFPALSTADSDTSYTGLQVAFGYEFANFAGFATGKITFNILALLAYILPIGAALLLIFKEKSQPIATIMFGVALFLFLLVPQFTVVTVTILGNVSEITIDWTYALGLIIAIILSATGLSIGLYSLYKQK